MFSRFQMPYRVWLSVWQGTANPSSSPTGCASLAEVSPPVMAIFRSAKYRQPLHAAVGGGVEEDAPADERLFGHVLDAEDAHAEHATARASLVGLFTPAPVVVEVALRGPHADVARAVELGADLADLGLDELVVVDERVLAEGPP